MPLLQDDEVIGTLSLFAMEGDFFTADEINLLTELSGNISFALESISRKEALNYLTHRDVLTGIATVLQGRIESACRKASGAACFTEPR